jgi:tRNA(fMet)-specific endonuclease VapC
MLFLPDTNAFSRYLQRRDEAFVAKVATEFPNLRIAAIVLAELEYGASKSGVVRHRQRLEGLLAVLTVESFSLADARSYGGLRADLERRGQCIGPHDMLIAAQALRLGATVVTHNTREFSRVPGLKCEDWQST